MTEEIKNIIWQRGIWLTLSLCVLIVLVLSPKIGDYFSIKKVLINNSLHYVEKKDVDSLVEKAIRKSLFSIELDTIAQNVNALPWVKTAEIKRIWPDTVMVHILEQDPVARWGEAHLINEAGDIFAPGKTDSFAVLPQLFGDDSERREVTALYHRLSEIFKEEKLTVESLKIESEYEWVLTLDNGLVIIFSTDQNMEEVVEFRNIYEEHLASELEKISHVDLRYDNGFVVAWKKSGSILPDKSIAFR